MYAKLPLFALLLAATGACTTPNRSLERDLGPLPREVTITAVHQQHRPDLRACFEGDETGGVLQVEVELRLPRSGTPASIRLIEPETLSAELRTCLEHAFSDVEYGEGRSGSTYYQVLVWDPETETLAFEEPVDAYRRWGLTGAEIESVFEVRRNRVDACYALADYALADDAPTGRVLLTVAIDREGKVTRAGIKSTTLHAPKVEDCLLELALESEFPPPRGGGVVVFDLPFRFRAGEGWVR